MCFRPSAVAASDNNQIQQGTCPTCGAPVAASIGIEAGNCPSCGNPIPANPAGQASPGDAKTRIL